jgi:hypothetical protein
MIDRPYFVTCPKCEAKKEITAESISWEGFRIGVNQWLLLCVCKQHVFRFRVAKSGVQVHEVDLNDER